MVNGGCPSVLCSVPSSSLNGHLMLDLGPLRTQDDPFENFSYTVSAESPFPRKVPDARRCAHLQEEEGQQDHTFCFLQLGKYCPSPAPQGWLGYAWNRHGTGLSALSSVLDQA